MCTTLQQLQQQEDDKKSQVNETDAGVQAAQEALILRRAKWVHCSICKACHAEVPA
jgi:type VI protein secretion system component VasF